jgi:hypothetical protein
MVWIKQKYFRREGTRDWVFGGMMIGRHGEVGFRRLVHTSDTQGKFSCLVSVLSNDCDRVPLWAFERLEPYAAKLPGGPSPYWVGLPVSSKNTNANHTGKPKRAAPAVLYTLKIQRNG